MTKRVIVRGHGESLALAGNQRRDLLFRHRSERAAAADRDDRRRLDDCASSSEIVPQDDAVLDGGCDHRRRARRSISARREERGAALFAGRQAAWRSRAARDRHGGGLGGEHDDPETFYAFTSFATPTTIYRADVDDGRKRRHGRRPTSRFDPAIFAVEQRVLHVEGRHARADVRRRPPRSARRARADAALRLWRLQHSRARRLFAASRIAWMERAACSRSRTFAAAANMARHGMMAAASPTSRTCSTISSPPPSI